MAVYVIIDIKVQDQDMYARYIERVHPIVEKFNGRYLARGGNATKKRPS